MWNVHGPNGRTFEDRYPGFAAWRQQHKGVAANTTLGTVARQRGGGGGGGGNSSGGGGSSGGSGGGKKGGGGKKKRKRSNS